MAAKHKQDFLYKPETPIIYKLWKGLSFDSSTVKENLIKVEPTIGNDAVNLNKSTEVTFKYSDETMFLNMASNQSGFIVKIRFKTQHKPATARAAGDPWVDNEPANITLSNAWFGHLWDSAKISIGGKAIEDIIHFGTVFETLGLLRGYEYLNTFGISESICPDNGTGDTADTNKGRERRKRVYNYDVPNHADYREFQAFIPLHSIFGFCQDYNRVIRNMPVSITLKRNTDYQNCVFGEAHTNVRFELVEINLQIEQIIPSDRALIAIDDYLAKTDTIEVCFRAKACEFSQGIEGTKININIGPTYSSPRYFFIVCKDPAKSVNVQQNFGKLENGNIQNITVTLGLQKYPEIDQEANFNQSHYASFYFPLINVCRELYRNECALSMEDFKDIYTVFAIDTSNQSERGKNEAVNVNIKIKRNAIGTGIAKLEYYVIVFYDHWIKMSLKEGKVSDVA